MDQLGNFVRPGFHSITPYLVVNQAGRLMEFCKQSFAAEELMRVNAEGSAAIMHAELRIGDSLLELADGNHHHPPQPVELHLYVGDVDAVYRSALAAGAVARSEIVTQDYGDREAWIDDPSGNQWYIATHQQGDHYRPATLRDLTPCVHVKDARRFLDFLALAFGAEALEVYATPEGVVYHAKARIGDSVVEISEAHGQFQPLPPSLHLYVEDADATYRQALAAGATSQSKPYDAPYGDRAAGVVDPFGNTWWLATWKGAH